MKTILIFTLLTASLYAQFEKKTYGINGNLFFRTGESSTTTISKVSGPLESKDEFRDLSLSTSLSYFFIDNLSLGLLLTYSSSSSKHRFSGFVNDPYEGDSKGILLGPELRHFFKYHQVYPFLLGSYQYGIREYEFSPSLGQGDERSYRMQVLRIGVGLSVFISKSIALESIISYNKSDEKSKSLPSDSQTESVESDERYYSFGVGLNYYIK